MANIRVLHLEDNGADSELVQHLLAEEGLDVSFSTVQTRNEFTSALTERVWDVVLADYSLPAFDGFAALKIAQRIAPHLPFIFVSGRLGEDVVVETLKRGATDYVLKQKMERLVPAVKRALRECAEKQLLQQTEEKLRESEQRFRLLIDGIHDYAIYMIGGDGAIASWNSGAERIFGYGEAEAVGLPSATFCQAQDRQERRFERLLRQAEQTGRVQEELWQVRKNGDPFWADLIVTPVHVGKHLRGFAVVTQDVTERRRAKAKEEQNRQERAHLQEQFLSHVSHELRSPLTTIVDFTSIVAEGISGEIVDDQKQYLSIVLQAANRLAVMLNSLLDLTRTDWRKMPVTPDCIALDQVVRRTCEVLAQAARDKSISLSCDTDSTVLPFVYADPGRIEEVLRNLIDNAVKYSPVGSRIVVRTQVCASDPDFVQVSVTDTGAGIAAEQASHIFERFYRVTEASGDHPGGLGLGLYISREIVHAHGGELTLDTAPGRGSTFQFTLPRFSLQRILQPVMSPKNLAKGMAALITVKLPEMPNCPSGDFARYLASVREILQGLVHVNEDMVLPYICVPGSEDRLYVVVFTREEGLAVVLERIREHLRNSLELQPLHGRYELNGSLIDLSSWTMEQPEEAAHGLAEEVSSLIGLSAPGGDNNVRSKAQSASG